MDNILLSPNESNISSPILLDKCPNNTFEVPLNSSERFLKKENFLGEFKTQSDINKVLDNLGINLNKNLEWGNIEGFVESQKDLVNYLKDIPYNTSEDPSINSIQEALDKLLYKDLVITKFTQSPNIEEKGVLVSKIFYNWECNKNVVEQLFNNIKLDPHVRTAEILGSFNKHTISKLIVSDGIKSKVSYSHLYFYPGVYYGSLNKPTANTQDIVKMKYFLKSSRVNTVTINAASDEYIYICVPVEYGKATFVVGGFEGGFKLIDDNFQFEKYKGTVIPYYIYRSDNKGLGQTTVNIK